MSVGPLEPLIGTWEGTGTGGFPTIDDFSYREVLDIRPGRAGDYLSYVQETWRVEDGPEIGSHHETGFITANGAGKVHVLNAQGDDRVEILEGRSAIGAALRLDLESRAIAGDDRMIRTWRTIECDAGELRYSMGMATTSVPGGAIHLNAFRYRR